MNPIERTSKKILTPLVTVKTGAMFWLWKRNASAMMWQSFGSGPPPEGVKQMVEPLIYISRSEVDRWFNNLQVSPQTSAGACRDCNRAPCWMAASSAITSHVMCSSLTFLSAPMNWVEVTILLPLQMSSVCRDVSIFNICIVRYVRLTNDNRVADNETGKDKGCEERCEEHVCEVWVYRVN